MSQVWKGHAIGMLAAGMTTRDLDRELDVNFSTISHLEWCLENLAVCPTGLTTAGQV
jgi:hypothetical protein